MRTDEIIQNLKYTAKKHENDKVFTGQLNISSMCKDILPKMEQLKAYEDAEEQGLLLRLPCKVGDKVWQATSEVHKYIVTCIAIRGDGVIINTQNYETGIGFSFNAKRIGQRYFLTKEEAEQKLEEMKGEV